MGELTIIDESRSVLSFELYNPFNYWKVKYWVFKGIVHPKMKMLSFIIYPQVVQTRKSFVYLRNTS